MIMVNHATIDKAASISLISLKMLKYFLVSFLQLLFVSFLIIDLNLHNQFLLTPLNLTKAYILNPLNKIHLLQQLPEKVKN